MSNKKIIATYDYKKDGKLIHQTVRYEPKKFLQRRPDGKNGWIWDMKGIKTILYNLDNINGADQVIICEGEKDADALIDLGLSATTCPMGAGKWKEAYNHDLNGKEIILIPDNDPLGEKHMHQVAKSLSGVAKSMKMVDLPDVPEKGDVSDYLEDNTKEELLELIDCTAIMDLEACDNAEGEGSKIYSDGGTRPLWMDLMDGPVPDGSRTRTLVSYAGHLRHQSLDYDDILEELSLANQNCEPPLDEKKLQEIAKSYSKKQADLRATKSTVIVAKRIMKEHHFVHTAGRIFYFENGVYKRDGEHFIKYWLTENWGLRYTMHRAKEVTEYIAVKKRLDSKKLTPQIDLINLKNGLLDWRTGKLKPHTPEMTTFTQLPVEYDPNARCPKIDTYLRTTLPEDCIELAIQFIGLCMIPYTEFQTALMLTGSGKNGKSVFIKLVIAFIGDENVAKIPLQEFDGNRFKRAELYGTLLNVFADLDKKALKGTGYFKTIVAGDVIDAERKFKDPFFFRPYARLIFSANEIPYSPDNSEAYYSRWKIIPFNQEFMGEKRDKDLLKKLTTPEELSGLLIKALRGLRDLFEASEFSNPKSIVNAKEDYKRLSDSVYAYTREHILEGLEYVIPCEDLYQDYKLWAESGRLHPVSRTKFNRKLRAFCNIERKLINGRWHWKGIELKKDDEG